jgi:hypothetical protein
MDPSWASMAAEVAGAAGDRGMAANLPERRMLEFETAGLRVGAGGESNTRSCFWDRGGRVANYARVNFTFIERAINLAGILVNSKINHVLKKKSFFFILYSLYYY